MPLKEIATFGVSHMQILDEHGKVDKELDPGLSEDELISLYRSMVLARELDERMLKLQRQGRLGTFPPCIGHEATTCAATFAMGDRDWFVGAFRETGGRLMRGEPIENLLLYYAGFEEGATIPASKRMLPIAVVIASQIPHAVGLAYAMKLKKEDSAVLTFFGDGATSEGDFHEALNLASLWEAPIVFLIQNNGWAISVPREKQTKSRTLAQKAIAYEMDAIQVDGNDALAVYRATKEAMDKAKAGKGPTLIESITYRLSMHTTADDPKKYRDEADVEEWWDREPLKRFRIYLEDKGFWDQDKEDALRIVVRKEIMEAMKRFEARQSVEPDKPFDHVFGTSHPVIEDQRQKFLADIRKEAKNA